MIEPVEPWRTRWTNFRGYKQSANIEFPAMTLLIGRNNVGKTSAYAPLLLLRQTLDARKSETALLLRGELVDFGQYADVVTDHDTNLDLSFYLEMGVPEHAGILKRKEGVPIPHALELSFGQGEGNTILLKKSVVLDSSGRSLVGRTRQRDGKYRVTSPLLPSSETIGRPLKEVTELRSALREESPHGYFFSAAASLRLPTKWRRDKDRWEKVQDWYRAVSDVYDLYWVINSQIHDSLMGISYIGPLRSPTRRTYLVSAERPDEVGRDGEWAVEVLYQSSTAGSSVVLDRTNMWLGRLGYGHLDFTARGEYFQAFLCPDDSQVRVNIADCGVGLSQLLPLIVQGCVMDPGQTLIAQQPEIHLNPAQQDVMTDFLLELSAAGKRVIVETHSEHVLGRLRRRVAEGRAIPAESIAIYFCDSRQGRSSMRRIPMGELAEINASDWPTGFFNEQLENSMQLALAQSRNRTS